MNKNEVLKKIKKKLFEIPKKEDVDRAVKFLVESVRREEAELVLYDEIFLKDLAELAKILLGEKNGN